MLTYGRTPRFDPKRWTFRCFGLVEREVSWTWEEFLRLPRVTLTSDIHCVTRWSKLDNTWEGVHVRDDRRGVPPAAGGEVRPAARRPRLHDEHGASRIWSTTTWCSRSSTTASDLEPDHGGPMRLVLPKLYFWKSSKWLRAFEFLDVNPPGFWEQNGYHMHADPWPEERYSDQETRAMQQMRAEAARRLRER